MIIDQTSVSAHLLVSFVVKVGCPDVDRDALNAWLIREFLQAEGADARFFAAACRYLKELTEEEREDG